MTTKKRSSLVPAWTRRRSRRGVGLISAAALLASSCSSRQAQADSRAEDGVTQVVTLLAEVPFERWSRPPASVRETLATNSTQYRVLSAHAGGANVAVWRSDTGVDPFTDDTVRIGLACAWVEPGAGSHRLEDCPRHLAREVSSSSIDWSDASAAHDAALVDISDALIALQQQVRQNRVGDRPAAVTFLERRGLTVDPRPGADPKTVSATVRRTASAERISDTNRTVSATSCATVNISLDPQSPFYSSADERPCAAQGRSE